MLKTRLSVVVLAAALLSACSHAGYRGPGVSIGIGPGGIAAGISLGSIGVHIR